MSNEPYVLEVSLGVADFRSLRGMTGWGVPDPAVARAALEGSLFGLTARVQGRAVGMLRVVGDGALNAYIQDLVVDPAHRRAGIGRALVEMAVCELGRTAPDGLAVGLMAAHGADAFYRSCGFRARPNPDQGAGFQARLSDLRER